MRLRAQHESIKYQMMQMDAGRLTDFRQLRALKNDSMNNLRALEQNGLANVQAATGGNSGSPPLATQPMPEQQHLVKADDGSIMIVKIDNDPNYNESPSHDDN